MRLTIALALSGAAVGAASIVFQLPTVLGISSSLLIGAATSAIATAREGRHSIRLHPSGIVAPIEKPQSDPTKYRLVSHFESSELIVFDQVKEVRTTVRETSGREGWAKRGLRIILERDDKLRSRNVGIVHIWDEPWLDFEGVLSHLRAGLGQRWREVYRPDLPLVGEPAVHRLVWDDSQSEKGRSS